MSNLLKKSLGAPTHAKGTICNNLYAHNNHTCAHSARASSAKHEQHQWQLQVMIVIVVIIITIMIIIVVIVNAFRRIYRDPYDRCYCHYCCYY